MRARRAVLAAMLAAIGLGCESGPTSPVDTVATKPSPVQQLTVKSIAIVGDTNVYVSEGGKVPYRAVAEMSDGTPRDYTPMITWVSDNPTVLDFSTRGVGTAFRSGFARVSVTVEGITASIVVNVRIVGDVARSAFPNVTPEEWAFIGANNLDSEGRTNRMNSVVRVWSQGEINISEVLDGLRLYTLTTGVRFESSPDSASATMWFVLGKLPPGDGGQPIPVVSGNVITSVVVVIDSLGIRGMSAAENRKALYAHEGGHSLGIRGHYKGEDCDIMNVTTCNAFVMSGFMGRVYGVLYTVPHGTRFY